MRDDLIPIDQLIPDPKNARKHPERNKELIENSIKEFGAARSIVIDGDGIVRAGNGTLEAAKAAGLKKARIVESDGKTLIVVKRNDLKNDSAVAYSLVDNRSGELAEWDTENLSEILSDLDFDNGDLFESIGFSSNELEDLGISTNDDDHQEQTDPDDAPEIPKIVLTKPGDVWQLGKHRLICGDATNQDDVSKLMRGQVVDMVFADPPYNADYNPDRAPRASSRTDKSKMNKRKMGGIRNDAMSTQEYRDFVGRAFRNMLSALKPGGVFYLCCNYPAVVDYSIALPQNEINISSCIVWDKTALILDRKDYHASHELILYGWKTGSAHFFIDDKTQTDTWAIKRDSFREYKHPTQKPVEMITRAINNHDAEFVLDLFVGSGSTLIGCEKTGRTGFGLEIDPHYCDVICKRFFEYTGTRPIRESDGLEFSEYKE